MRAKAFLVLAILLAALARVAAGEALPSRLGLVAELSAAPLLGIDRPIKGCSAGLALGATLSPFEAGIRIGGAFDAGLGVGLLRIDLELSLGSGLRAIVGGLLPFGELSLPDPGGSSGLRIPVEAAPWPDRFGLASSIADLPWRILGARMSVDAELVYTDYRLGMGKGGAAAASLSGAAAFAAGVEATLGLRLRWGSP